MGEVSQAASMIGVNVGQHQPAHILGRETTGAQLRPDLVLWRNLEAHAKAIIRAPARKVAGGAGLRRLTGVNDDQAFGVLNHPGVDRQLRAPCRVEQRGDAPERAAPAALQLPGFDRYGAGLDRVGSHTVAARVVFVSEHLLTNESIRLCPPLIKQEFSSYGRRDRNAEPVAGAAPLHRRAHWPGTRGRQPAHRCAAGLPARPRPRPRRCASAVRGRGAARAAGGGGPRGANAAQRR